MNLEIFTMAERVDTTRGQYSIINAFDKITSPGFPLMVRPFYVAVRLRFERHEVGQHTLTYRFVDVDGRPVAPPFDAALQVPPLAVDTPFGTMRLGQAFGGILFQQPGEYACHLDLDGVEIASLPFIVSQS